MPLSSDNVLQVRNPKHEVRPAEILVWLHAKAGWWLPIANIERGSEDLMAVTSTTTV